MLMYKWWNSVNSQQNIFVYNKDLILKKRNWLFFWFSLVIVCIWATYQGPVLASAFYLWILVLHLHKSSFSVGLVYLDVLEFVKSPFHAQGDLGGSSATLAMSSLLNVGAWCSEHCSTNGVVFLGPHWNGPGDKAQGTRTEQLKRQSLLASGGGTYSLKGWWLPPALQRYGFPNLTPGECKGKHDFGEVKSGCKIKPFMRQASASSEASYHLLP